MTVPETFATWTLCETIISVVALLLTMALAPCSDGSAATAPARPSTAAGPDWDAPPSRMRPSGEASIEDRGTVGFIGTGNMAEALTAD